jgi:hypothetical protein
MNAAGKKNTTKSPPVSLAPELLGNIEKTIGYMCPVVTKNHSHKGTNAILPLA